MGSKILGRALAPCPLATPFGGSSIGLYLTEFFLSKTLAISLFQKHCKSKELVQF